LIPDSSDSYAACLPTELRGMSKTPKNRHCQNQRNKNGAGSLALRRLPSLCKKSTCSCVTIHFRTWVPYLTLLPTPSPTLENFLMQDFQTTLYTHTHNIPHTQYTIHKIHIRHTHISIHTRIAHTTETQQTHSAHTSHTHKNHTTLNELYQQLL